MLLGLATLYRSRVLLRASLMVLLKEEKMDFRLRKPTQLEAKRREFWRGAGKDTFFSSCNSCLLSPSYHKERVNISNTEALAIIISTLPSYPLAFWLPLDLKKKSLELFFVCSK